jgi:hypothetical protein
MDIFEQCFNLVKDSVNKEKSKFESSENVFIELSKLVNVFCKNNKCNINSNDLIETFLLVYKKYSEFKFVETEKLFFNHKIAMEPMPQVQEAPLFLDLDEEEIFEEEIAEPDPGPEPQEDMNNMLWEDPFANMNV